MLFIGIHGGSLAAIVTQSSGGPFLGGWCGCSLLLVIVQGQGCCCCGSPVWWWWWWWSEPSLVAWGAWFVGDMMLPHLGLGLLLSWVTSMVVVRGVVGAVGTAHSTSDGQG